MIGDAVIKAIVFDLDGVLVDAVDWHYLALARALKVFGYALDKNYHMEHLNGLPTRVKLERLGLMEPLRSLVAQLKRRYTTEIILQRCAPEYPKVMLLHALSQKYKVAVGSNAEHASVITMLQMAGLLPYITHVVGGDSVDHPKPAPDIYIEAFRRLELAPSECLVVEDSPPGLEAAYASGARVLPVAGHAEVHSGLFVKEGWL